LGIAARLHSYEQQFNINEFVRRSSGFAAMLRYLNSFGACSPRPTAECRAFYELSNEQRQESVRISSLEKQIVSAISNDEIKRSAQQRLKFIERNL
jgi:hypothetical protein